MHRPDFLNRANADYIDRLYEQYQRDPRALDSTWQAYFAGFDDAGGRAARPHGPRHRRTRQNRPDRWNPAHAGRVGIARTGGRYNQRSHDSENQGGAFGFGSLVPGHFEIPVNLYYAIY